MSPGTPSHKSSESITLGAVPSAPESQGPGSGHHPRAWRSSISAGAPAAARKHPPPRTGITRLARPGQCSVPVHLGTSLQRGATRTPGRHVQPKFAPTHRPGCHCTGLRTCPPVRRASHTCVDIPTLSRATVGTAALLGHRSSTYQPSPMVGRRRSDQPSPAPGLRIRRPATHNRLPRMVQTSPHLLHAHETPYPTPTLRKRDSIPRPLMRMSFPDRAAEHGQQSSLSHLPPLRPSFLCLMTCTAIPSPGPQIAPRLCSAQPATCPKTSL